MLPDAADGRTESDDAVQTGVEPDSFDEFYRMKNPPPDPDAADDADDAGDDADKGKGKGKAKGKGKKGGKDAKGKGKKKAKGEEDAEGGDELNSSVLIGPGDLIADMQESVVKYQKVWSNLDESENFQQKYDVEIAKEMVTPEAAETIRKQVDEQLLMVLENLKLQVQQRQAEASGKKGKKGGKKGGGKKGGKKGGKGKAAKGKGAKSKTKPKKMSEGEKACSGLTLDNMIEELVKFGILRRLPKDTKNASEFVGEFNYLGCAYEQAKVQQNPSMMQIRQCIIEHGVLPLGSSYVHENSPLVSSMLLFGPAGSGKTMLSKAIAKHTVGRGRPAAVTVVAALLTDVGVQNALWLDLSPQNIAGKLGSGKSDIARLVHMVFTVAKDAAPAVIYMDQVEKMFSSSKKKADADEVTRLKKQIMAYRDMISKEDRVIFIGNSSCPFDDTVEQSEMKSFFSPKTTGKVFYLPYPDYASRSKLWKTFISKTVRSVVVERHVLAR